MRIPSSGDFFACGGGFGWFGFGRPGTRVAAGHSRSSYTWRRARAPHPSRSWDRRRPPRGPPPRTPWPFAWTSSFTRTAVVDDGGAARVSPARVGAVRRGCARVSPLGRDAGLLLELRTVVDCFRSGRWGRAGVRSGRRVRRAWGEKRTLDACNTTPGRLRGRSARVEERRDRNWVPETIGASSTWPKDHARIGIASVEASQSRARAPPSRRVGRRNHESGSKRRLHAPARFR